jgi:hypothetical protein
LEIENWKRNKNKMIAISLLKVNIATPFWSHRKIRANEDSRVHPKQMNESNLRLNLLMTNAAVKLAKT